MERIRTLRDDLHDARSARRIYQNPFTAWILQKTGLKDKAISCAFYVALPNAIITLIIRLLASEGFLPWIGNADQAGDHRRIDVQTAAWTTIVGGLSFLAVFRATQAYTRFWQATASVQLLRVDWIDSCASILAFTSTSEAPTEAVQRFKHLMVRLFSLYHAAALLKLVEPGVDDENLVKIEVLNPSVLDLDATMGFQKSAHRLELVGQWIQVATCHAIKGQVVTAPPPIVSRCFQEMANGNVRFQDALKVKSIPFPRTYQMVCDLLLIMHWIGTPFFTSLWVNSPALATILSFCSVFLFWSLICVARSIENPFSTQVFIHEASAMQDEMNSTLLSLLAPIAARAPRLSESTGAELASCEVRVETLGDYWNGIATSDPVTHAATPSKVKFDHRLMFHHPSHQGAPRLERDHGTRCSAPSGGPDVRNADGDCEPKAETWNTSISQNNAKNEVTAQQGGGLGDIRGSGALHPARSADAERVSSIQNTGANTSCEHSPKPEQCGCSSASDWFVDLDAITPSNTGALNRSSAFQHDTSV